MGSEGVYLWKFRIINLIQQIMSSYCSERIDESGQTNCKIIRDQADCQDCRCVHPHVPRGTCRVAQAGDIVLALYDNGQIRDDSPGPATREALNLIPRVTDVNGHLT